MAFARDTSLTQEGNAPASSEPVAGTATRGGNAAGQPANFERLKPLAWMVGNWIDEGDESVVISSCKSTRTGISSCRISRSAAGRDVLTVHQRIGWDPVARRIRAWLFDSDGGYGESIWTQAGDHWQLTATGVRPMARGRRPSICSRRPAKTRTRGSRPTVSSDRETAAD